MDANELKGFPELCELSAGDRTALVELLEPQHFASGRRVSHAGTEAEGLILVAQGRIRVELNQTKYREILDAPVALGAHSLISVGPCLATVIAQTPCDVWRLDRSAYRRLVDDEPRVACRLLEGILAQSASLGRRLIAASEGDRAS